MKLSASSLKSYLDCPAQFYYARVAGLTEEDAFALVQKTLGGLPVHERYESGFEPMISHECGVGWGSYDLNEEGRLLALRIMMENARKNWAF